MTPVAWVATSSAVIAATLIIVAIFVIRTLVQLRRTAIEVERTVRRAQPVLTELEATVREVRGLSGQLTNTMSRVGHVVGDLENLSSQAARAGSVVLSGIGGPIGRAAAIWSAFRTGAGVFRSFLGHNHKKPRAREAAESTPASQERDQ